MAHPYEIERKSTGKTEKLTDNALLRLFDESGGTLLIWGEPGCGKTFTLVQLLSLLLRRADADPKSPVPVLVPLASWAMKQEPLDQWLATELSHHFGLSKADTPALLAEGGLLTILLDGLDEVRETARAACLTAIRLFQEKFKVAVVICCRVDEYNALPRRLARGEAIRVLPLTEPQMEKYLDDLDCDDRLAPMRQMLKSDPEWRELASTPLMLGMLATVHAEDGGFAENVGNQRGRRDAIFARYTRLMLQRKERRTSERQIVPDEASFTKGSAVHWLQQLARLMVKDQVTTYYIERMQPRWVRSKWRYRLVIGLIDAGIAAICVYLIAWTIGRLFGGVNLAVVFGLFGGLVGALLGRLIGTMLGGLDGGFVGGFFRGEVDLLESVEVKLDIRTIARHLLTGLIVGILCGLAGGGTYALFGGKHFVQFGTLGLGVAFAGGFVAGSFSKRAHPEPALPNQGIRNTKRLCVSAAILAGAIGMVIGLPLRMGVSSLGTGFWLGLLFFGGLSIIQHYAIRLALAWEGALPFPLSDRKLVAYLDAMRDRLLLKRTGGGWVFIHRELIEFLATEPFGHTPAEVEKALVIPSLLLTDPQ